MFLGGPLRHAWRTVLSSKRMILLVGFIDLLCCLPPVVYVMRTVHGEASLRADALPLAKRFDADFMADLRSHTAGFEENLAALCVVSLALFFLTRPLVMGSYVGLAATTRRARFSVFLKEGGAVYWKFLRLSALAVVAAFLLSIAAKPLFEQIEKWAASRPETTAVKYGLVTNAVVFGVFCVVAIVFEYARIGIRMNRRPGVVAEVSRSALFVLQHPVRTAALFLLSLAIEVAAIHGVAWCLQLADGGYLTTSVIVLVLVQFVVTLREAVRLFHVAGAWKIRNDEAGDERDEPEVIVPEPPESDVLRDPLPWNVR